MRKALFSLGGILVVAAYVSVSPPTANDTDVAKTKERIWNSIQDKS